MSDQRRLRPQTRFGRRAALTAAATWPVWIRTAFAGADPECPSDPRQAWRSLEVVSEGFRRAQRLGKPLLVMVVPDDGGARWRMGQAFGELLNHGGDEAMALLALAEVICAPMGALRLVVPGAGEGEPTMMVVETHVVPARCRPVEARLEFREAASLLKAPEPTDGNQFERYFDQLDAVNQRLAHGRITALTEAIRTVLAADESMLESRAQLARTRLGANESAAWLGERPPESRAPAALLRSAALVLRRWRSHPAEPRLLTDLAGASRAQLCRRRVPGSRWAKSTGCGYDVEYEPGEKRDEDGLFACGMGRTPAISARFLDFLQADGSWGRD